MAQLSSPINTDVRRVMILCYFAAWSLASLCLLSSELTLDAPSQFGLSTERPEEEDHVFNPVISPITEGGQKCENLLE